MTHFDLPSFALGWGGACAVFLIVWFAYYTTPTRMLERQDRRRDKRGMSPK